MIWLTSWSTTSAVVPSSAIVRQDPVEAADHDRRQAQRDLVTSSSRGLPMSAPPDGEHLLLAAREVRPRLAAALRQHREELVHARRVQRPGRPRYAPTRRFSSTERLGRCAAPRAPSRRRGPPAHARAGRPPARRRSARPTPAPAARRRPIEERGLAGAVGADDGDRLALVGLERDVEERLEAAVEGAQVAGRSSRLTARRCPGRRAAPPGSAITSSGGPSASASARR